MTWFHALKELDCPSGIVVNMPDFYVHVIPRARYKYSLSPTAWHAPAAKLPPPCLLPRRPALPPSAPAMGTGRGGGGGGVIHRLLALSSLLLLASGEVIFEERFEGNCALLFFAAPLNFRVLSQCPSRCCPWQTMLPPCFRGCTT